MKAKKMNAKEIIAKHHGKIREEYSLINNWGYSVEYNGAVYDIRRWRNCYGSDCGWGVMWFSSEGGTQDEEWVNAISKDLNNWELNGEW